MKPEGGNEPSSWHCTGQQAGMLAPGAVAKEPLGKAVRRQASGDLDIRVATRHGTVFCVERETLI